MNEYTPNGIYTYSKLLAGQVVPHATVRVEDGKIYLQKGSEIAIRKWSSMRSARSQRKADRLNRLQDEANVKDGILQEDYECYSFYEASMLVSGHIKANEYTDWKTKDGITLYDYFTEHVLWDSPESAALLTSIYRYFDLLFQLKYLLKEYRFYSQYKEVEEYKKIAESDEKELNELCQEMARQTKNISKGLESLTPEQRMKIYGIEEWEKEYLEDILQYIDFVVTDSMLHGMYPNDAQKFKLFKDFYHTVHHQHRVSLA